MQFFLIFFKQVKLVDHCNYRGNAAEYIPYPFLDALRRPHHIVYS